MTEQKKRVPKVSVTNRGSEPAEALQSGHVGLDDAAAIIRKRLEGANPFSAGGSREIRLKVPGLVCRWFNASKNPDHIWRAKHQLGWQPVMESMVQDTEQLGGYQTEGGAVVRGERGSERLMYMREEDYNLLQMAKAEASDRSMGSSKKTKEELVRAAETAFGDEAASFMQDKVFGEVTDSVERTNLDHEIPDS